MHNGRWVILLIIAVGIGASAFAWWNRYQQGRHALEFWGPETAYHIRLAPEVTLLRLSPPPEVPLDAATAQSAATLTIDDRDWPIASRLDLSSAPGLTHAREALIQDQSFDWSTLRTSRPSGPSPAPVWEYAMIFRDRGESSTILLDVTHAFARPLDRTTHARPLTIAKGLRHFFDDFGSQE